MAMAQDAKKKMKEKLLTAALYTTYIGGGVALVLTGTAPLLGLAVVGLGLYDLAEERSLKLTGKHWLMDRLPIRKLSDAGFRNRLLTSKEFLNPESRKSLATKNMIYDAVATPVELLAGMALFGAAAAATGGLSAIVFGLAGIALMAGSWVSAAGVAGVDHHLARAFRHDHGALVGGAVRRLRRQRQQRQRHQGERRPKQPRQAEHLVEVVIDLSHVPFPRLRVAAKG